MKLYVVFALVAIAAGDVSKSDFEAPVVRSSYDISPEGSFNYAYETGNGIVSQAEGVVKNPNSDHPELVVTGAFKYTAPDGTPVELSYVADEQGYQPKGGHLPVSPPIPEAIQRSLDYIAAHPPPPPSNIAAAAVAPARVFG